MAAEQILTLAVVGVTLGVVEGVKPGPLLTVVIRETLSGGFRAGVRAAAAPLFTDGPMIVASLLAAGWIATQPAVLLLISVLGALFLVKMGVECFSIEPPKVELSDTSTSGSLRRGVLTNLLNPNAYVFWFLIGGPLMASAAVEEPLAPVAYALAFIFTLVMAKVTIAWMFDRSRGQLSVQGYRIALGVCGIAMLGFAAGFVYQAYLLYPQVA
ncbi:MAG: LysE family transporter [Candidatus Poseidoniia archaeon]|nr:LysE family transporter [Candidatus Poseidoniia archaeon]